MEYDADLMRREPVFDVTIAPELRFRISYLIPRWQATLVDVRSWHYAVHPSSSPFVYLV